MFLEIAVVVEFCYHTSGVNTERKVDIGCEKGTQISIFANKIARQVRSPNGVQIHFIYFSFSHYYVQIADLIKKLELCLMVVSVLLKIEFGHTQISVPKICILMLKIACINHCTSS